MIKQSNKRLDQRLIELGLAKDKKEAQALTMAGKVVVNDQRVDEAGRKVSAQDVVRIKQKKSQKKLEKHGFTEVFVSRAGHKLSGTLRHFQLHEQVRGARVLDVGASTGGFTDCMLQLGARGVVSLDVGKNQLAWSLREDPRVTALERTDIRKLPDEFVGGFDWVVADISFHSLAALIPAIVRACGESPNCVQLLLLVKPQFELARSSVPTGGVVQSSEAQHSAVQAVEAALVEAGLKIRGRAASPLPGSEGNQEIFVWAQRRVGSESDSGSGCGPGSEET